MKGKERFFLVVPLVMLMVAGSGCAKKESRYTLRYAHKILNWDLSRTREEVEFVSRPEDKEMKISLQENEVDIENLVGVLYTIMDFKSVAALEKISEGCYHFKTSKGFLIKEEQGLISVGASGEYYSFEEGPREEMPSIVVFNIEPEKSPIKILQLIYRYDDWIFKGDLFWLPVKISAEYVLEWRGEKKQLHQVWEFQGFKPEE